MTQLKPNPHTHLSLATLRFLGHASRTLVHQQQLVLSAMLPGDGADPRILFEGFSAWFCAAYQGKIMRAGERVRHKP